MTFGWPKKKSENDDQNSNIGHDSESQPDKNVKDEDYFSFSRSEKKSFEESVGKTKDLLRRAQPLFFDQIPTLSSGEIIDSLIASCAKVPEGKYDEVYSENLNTVLDSLMEYKKFELAAEVLKRLDISIPINNDIKNRIEELENYFRATDENKKPLDDLRRTKDYYSEADRYRNEKSAVKKNTLNNAKNTAEKPLNSLDESAIQGALKNPGAFIKQAINFPISDTDNFFNKFEAGRLSQVGITESRRGIEEKINFMKEDLIKKLMAVGDYKKALYYFDARTGSNNADSLLNSFFSAAAKNNDTKTVKIIQQITSGMYDRNRFPDLQEDIQEYLSLKESLNSSVIESLNDDEKVDEYDKKKAAIPDRRLNKILIDEYNEAGTIRQS